MKYSYRISDGEIRIVLEGENAQDYSILELLGRDYKLSSIEPTYSSKEGSYIQIRIVFRKKDENQVIKSLEDSEVAILLLIRLCRTSYPTYTIFTKALSNQLNCSIERAEKITNELLERDYIFMDNFNNIWIGTEDG